MDIKTLIFLASAEAVEKTTESGAIGTLGLNWKLFLAQLVNFGIVIFILWKWIMKPAVSALEARRLRIESSVKQAEEIERRMQEFEKRRAEELLKARAEAEAVMKKTLDVAATEKAEIMAQARLETGKIMAEAQEAVAQEKTKMLQEIREEVANLTVLVAEKILREKLNSHKDRELVAEVLKTIK